MTTIAKLSSHLVLAGSIIVGTVALASDETPTTGTAPYGTKVRQVSSAGSGCPADSLSSDLAADGTALVLSGHDFTAEIGPLVPLRASRKNCQINLDLAYPTGWQYAVKAISYGGSLQLDDGVKATVSAAYYFQGQTNTSSLQHESDGPLTQDLAAHDDIDDQSLTWSSCDASRALNINFQAQLAAQSADASGSVRLGVNSVDSVSTVVELVWRACN